MIFFHLGDFTTRKQEDLGLNYFGQPETFRNSASSTRDLKTTYPEYNTTYTLSFCFDEDYSANEYINFHTAGVNIHDDMGLFHIKSMDYYKLVEWFGEEQTKQIYEKYDSYDFKTIPLYFDLPHVLSIASGLGKYVKATPVLATNYDTESAVRRLLKSDLDWLGADLATQDFILHLADLVKKSRE
jgi:hypothetical protein